MGSFVDITSKALLEAGFFHYTCVLAIRIFF